MMSEVKALGTVIDYMVSDVISLSIFIISDLVEENIFQITKYGVEVCDTYFRCMLVSDWGYL